MKKKLFLFGAAFASTIALPGCDDGSVYVRGGSRGGQFTYVRRQTAPAPQPGGGSSGNPSEDGMARRPQTRAQIIHSILYQIQYHLVPYVGPFLNDTIAADLGKLCPDSTADQRVVVRSVLMLMIDDDFLAEVKSRGGSLSAFKHGLRERALHRDPSLANNSCLLDAIDEVVTALFASSPF